MASKLTKKINSQFNPTLMSGYPMYAYGGKLYFLNGGGLEVDKLKDWGQGQVRKARAMRGGGSSNLNMDNGDVADSALTAAGMFGDGVSGSTASGALSGLSAGAMFGPIGMGVGALAGGAAGFIGGKKKQQAEEDALLQAQQEMQKKQLINNLPAQHEYVPTFESGGSIGNKNIEQDTTLLPMNQFTDIYKGIDKYQKFQTSSADTTGLSNDFKNFNGVMHRYLETPINPMDTMSTQTLQRYVNRGNQLVDSLENNVQIPEQKGSGGEMPVTDRLTEFKNGGTHDQSPMGGIPVGQNALTEEGEFMYTTKKGKKYIFTDRF